MINTSYPIGVASYPGYQPLSAEASEGQGSGGHTVANPTGAARGFMPAPMMMAPMTMMSPAYMMAYPQMMGDAGAMAAAPGAAPGLRGRRRPRPGALSTTALETEGDSSEGLWVEARPG